MLVDETLHRNGDRIVEAEYIYNEIRGVWWKISERFSLNRKRRKKIERKNFRAEDKGAECG